MNDTSKSEVEEVLDIKFVDSEDPILHRRINEVDFTDPAAKGICANVYKILGETLIANPTGIGLSANQLGIDCRMFVMRTDPIRAFINPVITWQSDNMIMMKEGCLSFPGLFLNISRPDAVRIRYLEPDGKLKTDKFIGVSARVVLHEIDHLCGITFDKMAKPFELSLAKERQAKLVKRLRR